MSASHSRKRAGAALEPLPSEVRLSIATFAGIDSDGCFVLESNERGNAVLALSTIELSRSDVGARVVVGYTQADERPIIIGRLFEKAAEATPIVRLDGERLVFDAKRQIELRCGEASIVLTRAGKVIIRGTYVLSRSRGANKIKGAYVDIN